MFCKAAIIGECNQMCPESEILIREGNRLLHPLERLEGKHDPPKADRSKMVKEFSRSSAGQQMQQLNVLRPYNVLIDTLSYLLHNAINADKFPWYVRYEFIADRLRAIRQDMIIQEIPNAQSIFLLQPMVGFYTFSSYRLCNEKLKNFDPYLNQKYLQECVKRLLTIYDDCEEVEKRCFQNNFPNLDYSLIYVNTRPQIEALYILLNLTQTEVVFRCLSLSSKWKHSKDVQSAIKIALHYHTNEFITIFKLIKTLPPLLAIAAWQNLPLLRKNCLQVMCYAYNSKVLKFPLNKLQYLLLYCNINYMLDDLKICNIKYDFNQNTNEGGVNFIKLHLNDSIKLQATTEDYIDNLLSSCDLDEIILCH